MIQKSLLFWQPKTDYLNLLKTTKLSQSLTVFLNYLIWIFLFLISYLLIKNQTNLFWQLLIATIAAEIIEKIGKNKCLWKRPMTIRHDTVPPGLVQKWYQTGSFPSGHTIKATYFFLFLLQNYVFSPIIFLIITVPLLFFRVLVGFHYPIDMIGGVVIGFVIWFFVHNLIFPEFLINLTRLIFNFVFLIH
jgi:membrane-associated phospholipid phosphatase